MQKILKNKVVTLILAVLLFALAVLLLLDSLGVGHLYVGRRILHPLVGALLVVYILLALIPQIMRARRTVRALVIAEVVILALAAFAHLFSELLALVLLSDLSVCALIGLALALRGIVLVLDAYLVNTEKRAPLWHFIGFLALVVVGVWQLSAPIVPDRFVLLVIGVLALLAALYFTARTVVNFRKGKKKPTFTSLPASADIAQ